MTENQQRINVHEVHATFHRLSTDYAPRVRWMAAPPRGQSGRIEASYANNAAELAEFALAYADWNFYVQLNPSVRLAGARASTDDIVQWRWFLVDVDPVRGTAVDAENARAIREVILSSVRGYVGKPVVAHIVRSGRGIQFWFPTGSDLDLDKSHDVYVTDINTLDRNLRVSVPCRRAIAVAQSYWLGAIGRRLASETSDFIVDPSCSDLPRLARCPGTINHKTGQTAFVMDVGAMGPTPAIARRLLEYVPTEHYVSAAIPEGVAASGPKAGPWQASSHLLSGRAIAYLTVGYSETERHMSACAAARSLAEAGVEEGQIYVALLRGASLCRPALDDVDFLRRTAREAFVRVHGYASRSDVV